MNRPLKLSALSLVMLLSLGLSAQTKYTKYYEFGASLGTLNMSNGIANSNRVNAFFAEAAPNLSVFAKYHFNDWFGIGFDVSYANLKAADINHENANRGLSVTTSMAHANAFTEIHFIRFGKYHLEDKYTVFVKAGLGFAGWNPELTFDDLVPSTLDIETNAYNGMTSFYGIGAKYRLAYHSILTFEFRYTNINGNTTDGFIDMAPEATNPNDKVWGFNFGYSYAIL